MLFTPDPPTKPGWYWVSNIHIEVGKHRIVKVRDNEGKLETNVYGFWCSIEHVHPPRQWAGPIPEPTNA